MLMWELSQILMGVMNNSELAEQNAAELAFRLYYRAIRATESKYYP